MIYVFSSPASTLKIRFGASTSSVSNESLGGIVSPMFWKGADSQESTRLLYRRIWWGRLECFFKPKLTFKCLSFWQSCHPLISSGKSPRCSGSRKRPGRLFLILYVTDLCMARALGGQVCCAEVGWGAPYGIPIPPSNRLIQALHYPAAQFPTYTSKASLLPWEEREIPRRKSLALLFIGGLGGWWPERTWAGRFKCEMLLRSLWRSVFWSHFQTGKQSKVTHKKWWNCSWSPGSLLSFFPFLFSSSFFFLNLVWNLWTSHFHSDFF